MEHGDLPSRATHAAAWRITKAEAYWCAFKASISVLCMPPPVQCSDSLVTAMQEVDKEESKISISGRKVVLLIAKAGDTHEYWPRLLASKEKQNNITVRCYLRILKRNMPSNYTLAALSVSMLKSPLNRVCFTHIR